MLAAVFTALLTAAAAAQPASDAPKKVVIPFDFESRFDNGEYGQTIGEMLWAKLHRQGGFVIPESMQDVRDWCQRNKMIPGPETTLEKMKEIVVKEQAGDIGIWGKVERVQGYETDVYDLWINVADFSVDPPALDLPEEGPHPDRQRDPPHLRQGGPRPPLRPHRAGRRGSRSRAPEAMGARPRISSRAISSKAAAHRPAGTPCPTMSPGSPRKARTRKPATGSSASRMNEDVAGSTGVLYYSNFFPVEEGSHVSLPVPLADDRLGGQGLHQVLRRAADLVPHPRE